MTRKNQKIIVSGAGCCLVDVLYNNINFSGEAMRPFLSVKPGDGGLSPGKLVFHEEFEKFSGITPDQLTERLAGNRKYDKINIGGPSVVSLINTAQLTDREMCEVRFYGRGGNDENGNYLLNALRKTPVVLKDYRLTGSKTPSTLVLSDPEYDNGHGERIFVNSIGAAWDYHAGDLDNDFFGSDIVVFGGTALVPNIHDNLASLLKKAKQMGASTIINTVFDFRNEKADPSSRWPLGESDESYRYTDLLIADKVEALRLSGTRDTQNAISFFKEKKVRSVVITNGPEDVVAFSDGTFFSTKGVLVLPVSEKIKNELRQLKGGGDTTGCGDNFAGGVIASIVNQIQSGNNLDLKEACAWGITAGGYTCFYLGGTFIEEKPGEKLQKIIPYYNSYKLQTAKP